MVSSFSGIVASFECRADAIADVADDASAGC
jgi:hypothetical protein